MRILRISLRNIASLAGTHTIDFTRDPLRATGLFSISGSTGSGKSTLLDALCLALYERTPRLDAVRGAIKLNDGSDLLSQSDPANLLRRGAVEGFAEVAFVGVDRITYTARWKIRRAHYRRDGALQKTELTLFRGDIRFDASGVIEQGGKKSEVLPAIAAKVGLSFEQFTRAVLLAQNDFATFLKADDRERGEILQALTGTERFDAISRTVFDRFATRKKEIESLETQLEANLPMAPAQRAEAESSLSSAERAFKEAAEGLFAREKDAEWYKRLSQLLREVADAETLVDKARSEREFSAPRRIELVHTEKALREACPFWGAERRASEETAAAGRFRDQPARTLAEARTALHFWKEKYAEARAAFAAAKSAFEVAQPELRLARDLDAELRFASEQLAAATREHKSVEANLNQLIERRDQLLRNQRNADAEICLLSPKQASLEWLTSFAPEVAGWVAKIDRAIEARSVFADADREFSKYVQEELQRRNLWETDCARQAQVRAEKDLAVSVLASAEAVARVYDSESISFARHQAESARTVLHNLQNHLSHCEWLSGRAQDLGLEINKLRADNELDYETLLGLRGRQIPAAEHALKSARESFELAEAAVADATIRLREKLVPNLPCAVCGSLEHPYADHPPITEVAALRVLREECVTREGLLAVLRSREAGLQTVCRTREQQAFERNQSLQEVIAKLAAVQAVRFEHPEAAKIYATTGPERTEALVDRVKALDELIESLDFRDRERLAAERTRDAARTDRDNAVRQLENLDKRFHEFEIELGRVQSARESAASVRNKAADALKGCLTQLEPLFAGRPDADPLWKMEAFREEFCAAVAEFEALEKRIEELHSVIRECGLALVSVREFCGRLAADLETKASAEVLARSLRDQSRVKRAAIFNGRPADEVEAGLEDDLRSATNVRDDCAEQFAKAERDFFKASEEHKTAFNAFDAINARQRAAVVELDEWLAGFAAQTGRILDRPALGALLSRDEAWIRNERAALDALDSLIDEAKGALTVHKKALEGHIAARSTTDDETKIDADLVRLRSVQADLERRRDAARAALYADDQLQAACLHQSRELESRRGALVPWERLNELIGSADGAKFRSIAQRRTLDILVGYANVQLNHIAGRYSLARISESLNLVVVDRDMGDERRSVHTLSGGETFLVSLALALGLASLTSNRLRIESLFIDEGFGSLDPETLNTAMTALMSLEAQGRKVGIISHVPEMADAIPVQIRVVKGRNGASRIIVPGAP
jgi:exonuclease SbcC